MNFDFPETKRFLLVLTLAPEMQFLAFELKTLISLRNLISCLNTLIRHMKTKYEETSFIKVFEFYILRNIAFLHDNSFAVQFGSVGN